MITLDKTEEVHISIYHIGYASQGESSLFILHTSTGSVLYSLVIDCYEDNCNETDRILKEWNLERKVNLIIWTHPHDDHSIGMKHIIEKYSNKSTKYVQRMYLEIMNNIQKKVRNLLNIYIH